MTRIAWLVACGVLALGCHKGDPAAGGPRSRVVAPTLPAKTAWGETPVARVGDGVVTRERLERSMSQEARESQHSGRPERPPAAVLEALIEEELLVQQGVRDGVLADDDDVRRRMVARVVAKHEAAGRLPNPTPDQLRRYHEAHQAQFPAEERLRLRHLLLTVPADAAPARVEAIRRRAETLRREAARTPAAFPALARKHSQDPSASQGGELGHLPVARWGLILGPELATVAPGVAAGQVGPLLRSRQGFHVFQVVARTAQGADPLTVQRREILAAYQEEARAQRRADLIAALRQELRVEVDQARLAVEAGARRP